MLDLRFTKVGLAFLFYLLVYLFVMDYTTAYTREHASDNNDQSLTGIGLKLVIVFFSVFPYA